MELSPAKDSNAGPFTPTHFAARPWLHSPPTGRCPPGLLSGCVCCLPSSDRVLHSGIWHLALAPCFPSCLERFSFSNSGLSCRLMVLPLQMIPMPFLSDVHTVCSNKLFCCILGSLLYSHIIIRYNIGNWIPVDGAVIYVTHAKYCTSQWIVLS